MKKAWLLLLGLLAGQILVDLTAAQLSYAANPNLIPNSSGETLDSNTKPTNWVFNSWGENTANGSMSSTAHDGNRSFYTKVDSYTSGDAKWYAEPVAIQPNTVYVFSNSYRSTAASEVVLQYTDVNNRLGYEYIDTLAATGSEWRKSNFEFTPPKNMTKVSVFHTLPAKGELWTDAYSLSEKSTSTPTPPTSANLIANPSVENAANNQPSNWVANQWGSLQASHSYSTDSQNGSRSLYTKVTNRISGDAKWYFDSVNVKTGNTYTFSDHYKATAPSETIVQFTKTDGSYMYESLAVNFASPSWTKNTQKITIPSDVTKLSVFHVMAANGELWVDNFSLASDQVTPEPEPEPEQPNPISNASVETASSSSSAVPADWQTNNWGSNTARFEYVSDGQTGSKAIRTTVSSYSSGDAKWFFKPVALTAGKDYVFSDYYKSNTDSRIVIEVTTAAGNITYLELPGAPASANWTRYNGTFTMPANGVRATVYHMLSKSGTLTTDSYNIQAYKAEGFDRGIVTLTFDDGWEENTETALPIMQQHGFRSNQFYATTFIENPSVANPRAIIQRFMDAGHEIGSHTITHPDLTTLSLAEVDTELRDSKAYLQNFLGLNINYFATPYGAYNAAVKDKIMSYYSLHRTVDQGYNSRDNFDITRLKVQNVLDTTTAQEVAAWSAKAKADRTWLILVYHRVAPNPGPYDTTTEQFRNQMQAIKNNSIPVVTISQALNELRPQL